MHHRLMWKLNLNSFCKRNLSRVPRLYLSRWWCFSLYLWQLHWHLKDPYKRNMLRLWRIYKSWRKWKDMQSRYLRWFYINFNREWNLLNLSRLLTSRWIIEILCSWWMRLNYLDSPNWWNLLNMSSIYLSRWEWTIVYIR